MVNTQKLRHKVGLYKIFQAVTPTSMPSLKAFISVN